MKYYKYNKLEHTQLSTSIDRRDISPALAGSLKRGGEATKQHFTFEYSSIQKRPVLAKNVVSGHLTLASSPCQFVEWIKRMGGHT